MQPGNFLREFSELYNFIQPVLQHMELKRILLLTHEIKVLTAQI